MEGRKSFDVLNNAQLINIICYSGQYNQQLVIALGKCKITELLSAHQIVMHGWLVTSLLNIQSRFVAIIIIS